MSNRTERRAAEHASRKLAYKQLRQEQSQPAISEIQLAANQANAQLSCGPATPEGKAKSSKNALKHALTGATVLLPTDDAEQYQTEINDAIDTYKPATPEQLRLVQSMIDSLWRISRIMRLETALLYKGQLECAEKFADQPPARRDSLINIEAYLKYEKSMRNLQIQESRLHRRYEKDQAELTRLQTERRRLASRPEAQTHTNGFEFSTPPTPAQPAATFAAGAGSHASHNLENPDRS